MSISVSSLRANIYKIVDEVIETGVPVSVKRKGKKVSIVPEKTRSKMSRLKKRSGLNCDPDELVNICWEKEWKGHDLP